MVFPVRGTQLAEPAGYYYNLFVKWRAPTVHFPHIGINPYLWDALLIWGILYKISINKVISSGSRIIFFVDNTYNTVSMNPAGPTCSCDFSACLQIFSL